ncbi:MAG: rhomboid family intramembrane serine protease [Planctomycetota bacterium]|jgi:membrane associated rhomboid family serine protease
MIIPIGDDTPHEKRPYVNYALIGINVVVFLLFCFPYPRLEDAVVQDWAMKPAEVGQNWKTLFTSMFLHGSILHLLGNMVFLWVFGDNVEDRFGHVGYAVFYLFCGLVADAGHIAMHPDSAMPTLGASGAISGVVGAYALFYPRSRVRCLVWIFFIITWVHITTIWWVGFWILSQIFMIVTDTVGVAVFAHIGGFIGGLAIAAPLKFLFFPAFAGLRRAPRPSPARRAKVEEARPEVQPAQAPGQRYALLRHSRDLTDIGKIGTVAGAVTGQSTNDIIQRIAATRGVVVKNIDGTQAESIRGQLRAMGVNVLAVPMAEGYMPPRATDVKSVSWTEKGFTYAIGIEFASIPWTAPLLYAAGKIAGEPVLDILLSLKQRIRVRRSTVMRYADSRSRDESPANLQDLVNVVYNRRGSRAVNESVRLLAEKGSQGWLPFATEADYEDHVFWAFNVTLMSLPLEP